MLHLVDHAEGFDLTKKQIKGKLMSVCPVCATTKATLRVPREPARRRAQQVGKRLHIDSWGPYPVVGVNNTIHFLIITDDFSRFAWGMACPDKIGMA